MDDDGSHGVPEWVVTYGDMMSLLLTFFIMLVSLSEVIAEDKYRAILDALQRYVGYRTTSVSPPGTNYPLNSLVSSLKSLGSHTNSDTGHGGVKIRGVDGKEFRVYRVREGKPIRVGEPILFRPLEAALTDEAKNQLASIAVELAGIPNKIVIRGHTSPTPVPVTSEFGDRFLLSYERARNVFLFLKDRGIDYKRMRIEALADNEPPPPSGDRKVVQSDRVEVVLLDAFADEFIGPRDRGL